MNEASFSLPLVISPRVRQRRHKFEVLELRCDRRQLLEIEKVGARASSIKKPDGPLLFTLDVIGQDRPKRRHSRATADQQHRAGPRLPSEAGAIRPFGDQGVAYAQRSIELGREGPVRVFLDDKAQVCAFARRVCHRKRTGDRTILKRQINILSGPELQRSFNFDFQQPDVGGQRADLHDATGKCLHGDRAT